MISPCLYLLNDIAILDNHSFDVTWQNGVELNFTAKRIISVHLLFKAGDLFDEFFLEEARLKAFLWCESDLAKS